MPIRASEKSRYPKDWAAISLAIRERAGWRCEQVDEGGNRCEARNREPHPITGSKVVLTCAHLDHVPENVDPSNLMAMCQMHHLRYDAEHHRTNAARTRRARLATAEMFA